MSQLISGFSGSTGSAVIVATSPLRSLYSDPTVAIPGYPDDPRTLLVQNLRSLMCFDGPQIVLHWDRPQAWEVVELIRLVRKSRGFPLNVDDGTLIYEGPGGGTTVVDEAVEPGTPYYYTIFSKYLGTGEWLYSDATRVEAISRWSPRMGDILWSKMPAVYHVADRRDDVSGATMRAFTEATLSGGSLIHIGEDGTIPRGQLERFLRLVGAELDTIHFVIDQLPTMLHAETTLQAFLAHMAELLNWETNFELPVERQRQEVLSAVTIYKRKGTAPAIEAYARTITACEVRVWPFVRNVLIANRLDRLSGVPNDPVERARYGLPDSKMGHSVSFGLNPPYNPTNVGLFIYLRPAQGLTEVQVHKLARTLSDFTPAGTNLLTIVVDDGTLVDEYGSATAVTEAWGDTHEEGSVTEGMLGLAPDRILWSNTPDSVSNSNTDRSPTNAVAREDWYDEFVI